MPPTRPTRAAPPTSSRATAPVPTAPRAAGPCPVCGRAVHRAGPVCFCCRTVADQLGLPLVRLVALCEYQVGDRTHRRLRAYKDAASAEGRAASRRVLVERLSRWERSGGPEALDAGPGRAVVTTVPSSRRPGDPPVAGLVGAVPGLADRHVPLLVRGPGPIGHLRADRTAFALADGVDRTLLARWSVLVVDDTTTTGAAAQSAAAALRLAGARVVAAVALGRAVAPPRPHR